jgi:hypothetical protein
MLLLRKRSQTIDWVKYNIIYGVYVLWNRIKSSLRFEAPAAQLREVQTLMRKAQEVENSIRRLIKPFSFAQKTAKHQHRMLEAQG